MQKYTTRDHDGGYGGQPTMDKISQKDFAGCAIFQTGTFLENLEAP